MLRHAVKLTADSIIIIIKIIIIVSFDKRNFDLKDHLVSRRKQVPFSMAIEMENSCKHLRMGTARMNYDNGTEEEGKRREVNIRKEVQRARRITSPDGLTTAWANSPLEIATPRSSG